MPNDVVQCSSVLQYHLFVSNSVFWLHTLKMTVLDVAKIFNYFVHVLQFNPFFTVQYFLVFDVLILSNGYKE